MLPTLFPKGPDGLTSTTTGALDLAIISVLGSLKVDFGKTWAATTLPKWFVKGHGGDAAARGYGDDFAGREEFMMMKHQRSEL